MHQSEFPSSISRTIEFLSCARTCLKILQQQTETKKTLSPELQILNPNDINLFDLVHKSNQYQNDATDVLKEATLTLNLQSSTLTTLRNLVKRRGSTNDPTAEINKNMSSFHSYSNDLLEILQNSLPRAAILSPFRGSNVISSNQRIKHYDTVGQILKIEAEELMTDFKKLLDLRGNILKEIALRRKQLNMFHVSNQISSTRDGNLQDLSQRYQKPKPIHHLEGADKEIVSLRSRLESPLFSATSRMTQRRRDPSIINSDKNDSQTSWNLGNGAQSFDKNLYTSSSNTDTTLILNNTSVVHDYNVGYGGSNSYGAYGSSTTGMRRRGTAKIVDSYAMHQLEDESKVHDSNSIQSQIQMRRQSRQTHSRLESARQAEKTLSELTQMFGKMSSLIQSQGETLLKIEDDVEAAFHHVETGREELIKLHEWTSGNRGLIVKVFTILMCLIIFMRFYG